jgi:CRP/FNR family transcriptional regulator, cyclic AMP receptor protein
MSNEVENQQLIINELASKALPSVDTKRHRILEAGDNLNSILDMKNYFYFIIEGKLKISQLHFESGKEQTLYLLTRGDMLDVVTLLDGKAHDSYAVALERTDVVEVPMESVRQLLDSDPNFKQLFFPYLAKQLRDMEGLAVDLSFYDVYQRLINLFSRFVDTTKEKASLKLINNLSHEELASMVGSVRKVVNRNLQKLKDEGIIELSRKNLKLSNLTKLKDKLKF